jgi:hypothetical protein
MLACSTPIPLGGTSLRSTRRRRRLVPLAAAKKGGKAASNARLARILRQYGDESAVETQQQELQEYRQQRDSARGGSDFEPGSSRLLRDAKGNMYENPGFAEGRQLVFRYDPANR